MPNAYYRSARTGGGGTALDGIDGSGLSDNDFAIVLDNTLERALLYRLDADLAQSEADPVIITPDANAGNKRWILQNPSIIPPTVVQRAKFVYNGGSTAYTVTVSAAQYMCKEKHCRWITTLTSGAIGSPSASTWYYLYLDYSAITSGKAITASELIWSSTAPTWSDTYRGWYNGDDLCIFAVLTNGTPTNILEFFHAGGDLVMFADGIVEASGIAPSTTWTDVDVASSVPAMCTQPLISIQGGYVSSGNWLGMWRTNGQTGTTGHYLIGVNDYTRIPVNQLRVHTDSSRIFEVKWDGANSGTMTITVDGWHFPVGM
jgi:hypothetical protein